jgi:hypothetical protein
MLDCRFYSGFTNMVFVPVESLMKIPKRRRELLITPDPSEENEVRQNPITQGRVDRHYESGKNPEMQPQRSNRQGSGVPTQQRVEDR